MFTRMTKTPVTTDIFISGGGVAGLTAAAAFGAAGFSVVIADPMPPITDQAVKGADLRTTAFLQPAREFLMTAGLWNRLAPFATPLPVSFTLLTLPPERTVVQPVALVASHNEL